MPAKVEIQSYGLRRKIYVTLREGTNIVVVEMGNYIAPPVPPVPPMVWPKEWEIVMAQGYITHQSAKLELGVSQRQG